MRFCGQGPCSSFIVSLAVVQGPGSESGQYRLRHSGTLVIQIRIIMVFNMAFSINQSKKSKQQA